MTDAPSPYLTTQELAELLRLKERKIYDLAASGELPCLRATGKLLFPRVEIEAWLAASHSGPRGNGINPPPIAVGSHDPLLDLALRNSASGMAGFFDGSHDGLHRFARGDASLAALHIHETDDWNVATVREQLAGQPVVLLHFAKRQRGLLTAPGNPLNIRDISDITRLRSVARQPNAASQRLLVEMLVNAGHSVDGLNSTAPIARSEDDLARAIANGQADVGFGLAACAHEQGLGFVPLLTESFDILVWQSSYFAPETQRLLAWLRSPAAAAAAKQLGGYDISDMLSVRLAL